MKRKSHPRNKRTTTKSVLRLPDLEHAKTAVLNSLTSPDAQWGYRHAINEFVDWYCSEPRLTFNRIVVLRYRSHLESRQLAPGTVNRVLAQCGASHTKPPRSSECRSGSRHSESERRQKVGRTSRELANSRAEPCALASTRSSTTERQTRPRLACAAAGLRMKKARGRSFKIGSSSAARGALGDCRSSWQGRLF
jgi:hypothetical protein